MKIELLNKALIALVANVETCRQDDALLEVSDRSIDIENFALEACEAAGWDWENNCELVRFCLKATPLERADENLKHFIVYMAEQIKEMETHINDDTLHDWFDTVQKVSGVVIEVPIYPDQKWIDMFKEGLTPKEAFDRFEDAFWKQVFPSRYENQNVCPIS